MQSSAITLASDISVGNLDRVPNEPVAVLLLVQQFVDSILCLSTEVYRGFRIHYSVFGGRGGSSGDRAS